LLLPHAANTSAASATDLNIECLQQSLRRRDRIGSSSLDLSLRYDNTSDRARRITANERTRALFVPVHHATPAPDHSVLIDRMLDEYAEPELHRAEIE
jgi:hypothetical protein